MLCLCAVETIYDKGVSTAALAVATRDDYGDDGALQGSHIPVVY